MRTRRLVQEQLLQEALLSSGSAATGKPVPGPHGKPWLPSVPSFHFNFTDSGDYILLAWSNAEIGVDLQRITETRYDPLRVAERFYTGEEAAHLKALPDPAARRQEFFRLWSIKEAYLKYLGIGLSGGMNRYRIVPDRQSGNRGEKDGSPREERNADNPQEERNRADSPAEEPPFPLLQSGLILPDSPPFPPAHYVLLQPPEPGYTLCIVQKELPHL